MAIEVGREYRLEIAATVDTPKTVSGATNAAALVVTSTSHGYTNGDYVMFRMSDGMVEAEYLVAKIVTSDTNTMTFTGVNSSSWGAFDSGATTKTVAKILTWTTVATATSIDFGQGAAEEIDTTVLLDRVRRVTPGLLALPAVSVNLFTDSSAAVQDTIDGYAYASTAMPWRATKKSGARRVWAGVPSTIGESVSVNQPIAGTFNIVVKSSQYTKYTS
jgi:Phage tail tube protein, TTP